MEHGRYTADLGEKLEEWLRSQDLPDLKVYYDHGRKGLSKVVPYFGEYSRATTLSFVDFAVVDTACRQALVLCELEEEGASPKKVIGDIGNLLMAEWLCIGGQRYSFDYSHVIVGICVRDGGKSKVKAEAICRRARMMVTPKRLRGLTLRVRANTDCRILVDEVSDEIKEVVRRSAARAVSTASRRASPRRPCRP